MEHFQSSKVKFYNIALFTYDSLRDMNLDMCRILPVEIHNVIFVIITNVSHKTLARFQSFQNSEQTIRESLCNSMKSEGHAVLQQSYRLQPAQVSK